MPVAVALVSRPHSLSHGELSKNLVYPHVCASGMPDTCSLMNTGQQHRGWLFHKADPSLCTDKVMRSRDGQELSQTGGRLRRQDTWMQAGPRIRQPVNRVTGKISGKSLPSLVCSPMSWFQPWCFAIWMLTLGELNERVWKTLSYFYSIREV